MNFSCNISDEKMTLMLAEGTNCGFRSVYIKVLEDDFTLNEIDTSVNSRNTLVGSADGERAWSYLYDRIISLSSKEDGIVSDLLKEAAYRLTKVRPAIHN